MRKALGVRLECGESQIPTGFQPAGIWSIQFGWLSRGYLLPYRNDQEFEASAACESSNT